MGRKPKLFLPLTVTFFDDDRIIAAGDGPTLLYLAMALRCKAMGSDGRITEQQIARLNRPRWRRELDRLAEVRAVLFDESTSEWFIAAWFGHNEAMESIDARRAADRDRKKNSARIPDGFPPDSGSQGKGRERKGRNPDRNPTHRFADDGSGTCTTCSLPEPNQVHLRLVGEAS